MLHYFGLIPDEGPLWTETCSNIQCDIVMRISKERVCAVSNFSVVG